MFLNTIHGIMILKIVHFSTLRKQVSFEELFGGGHFFHFYIMYRYEGYLVLTIQSIEYCMYYLFQHSKSVNFADTLCSCILYDSHNSNYFH